jgi:hypothetical protein
MKDSKSKIEWLIFFGLLVMPLLSFSEIITYMQGYSNLNTLVSPWYIKGIKDFIFLMILFIGVYNVFITKNKLQVDITFYILAFLVLVSALISLDKYNVVVVSAGLRWFMPLLLVPFLINNVDDDFQEKIAKTLLLLVLLGLAFQLLQTGTLNLYHGSNSFGFSIRNPGFFTIPSTMSIFLLLALWYVHHFLDKTILNLLFVYLIIPISVFLAGSATGILVLASFYFSIIFTKVKSKKAFAVLGGAFLMLIFVMLPYILGRADVMTSLLIRLDLYQNISIMNLFIGDRFGLATNTALLLPGESTSKAFSTDALVLSFIINAGLISFLLFLYIVIKNGEKTLKYFQFLLITSVFSFNSILFEVYPANLLIAVNLAYFISKKQLK